MLTSVKNVPSLAIVTALVSLNVRLLRVMFAPNTIPLCCVAPLAEKTTLSPAPGTRAVEVYVEEVLDQLLRVP